jgi:hypothetical protein
MIPFPGAGNRSAPPSGGAPLDWSPFVDATDQDVVGMPR